MMLQGIGITGASADKPSSNRDVTVAQFNLHNLFDTYDNARVQDQVVTKSQYDFKLRKVALALRDSLAGADIVTVQEAENIGVLQDLVKRPELAALGYRAVLLEGTDPRGIDSGVLYRASRVTLVEARQENAIVMSASGNRRVRLFTRPPLVTRFERTGTSQAQRGQDLVVIANHFTSKLRGPESDARREQQASFVGALSERLDAERGARMVVVTGDLNATPDERSYRQMVGSGSRTRLVAASALVPAAERYSWRDGSHRYLLDHVLVSAGDRAGLLKARFERIGTAATAADRRNPDSPVGTTDHDAVIVSLRLT